MRKIYLIAGMWAALFSAKAQQVATFEEIDLQPGSWYNGSDGAEGFMSGGLWFPNNYIAAWEYWEGFSVSNMQDTISPGWGNQYSAITAEGANNSENYAVAYAPSAVKLELNNPTTFEGVFITNSVYAYLAMRDGDDITKKFGGPDGSDPDYFLLMISGTDADGNPTDTVNFYLADFRSENPEEDYIVNDWMWVDLSSLQEVTVLSFYLKSSDTGDWGMNNPAYFCIDDLTTTAVTSSAGKSISGNMGIEIYPNPVTNEFNVVLNGNAKDLVLTNATGRVIYRASVNNQHKIRISALENMPSGIYFLKINTGKGTTSKKIIKY